jgi:hypothetical protein
LVLLDFHGEQLLEHPGHRPAFALGALKDPGQCFSGRVELQHRQVLAQLLIHRDLSLRGRLGDRCIVW